MINYKRITIIFLFFLFFALILYLFFPKKQVNGIIAGYLLGLINFFVISFLVKRIFGFISETVVPKVIKMLLIYLFKILFFSFVIFIIIINRNVFGIIGFIVGFTLTVVIIFIESLMIKDINKEMTN